MSTAISSSPLPQGLSNKTGVLGTRQPTLKKELTLPPENATKLTKHSVLPPIGSPTASVPTGSASVPTASAPSEPNNATINPFILPPATEIFTLRERERQRMKNERTNERLLKVHEKSTYSSRLNAKMASLRKQILSPDSLQSVNDCKEAHIHDDAQFVLKTTKDRHIENEDLVTFMERKKEMFLVQYALGVKREEIKKLEDIIKTEEKKLEAAEKYLDESSAMFDEFLKENDRNAVEAIKMAEAATKSKLEKMAEIKKRNIHLLAIKNGISRYNDMLTELRLYKTFLDGLVPPESREPSTKRHREDSVSSNCGETEMFHFDDPNQLISLFTELEEQNLSLIQNSQDTQETLEELRQHKQATEKYMNREIENLTKQVDFLKRAIAREETKEYELEIKLKMYSYGEYRAEDTEEMLKKLDKKVADVYTKCIGTNEASISTIQMLAAIEGRLENLFEALEGLPVEKVEAAEKTKEKERRIRQREEKIDEQRQAQEERLRRALERAHADPKKRTGRRLIYRSEPPVLKRRQEDKDERKEQEEEDMQYFFS